MTGAGLIETLMDVRGGELAANGSQKLAELQPSHVH
jgi:hypothetical protein